MLEVLMTKNENNSHAFMKKMAENIKLTKDAQSPDESKTNEVRYMRPLGIKMLQEKILWSLSQLFFLLHAILDYRMFIHIYIYSQFLLDFITAEFYYLRTVYYSEKDIKTSTEQSWLVGLSGFSASLRTKGLLVQFPVRAHSWVAGQDPSRGHARGNHTLMFLFLTFSHPSPKNN